MGETGDVRASDVPRASDALRISPCSKRGRSSSPGGIAISSQRLEKTYATTTLNAPPTENCRQAYGSAPLQSAAPPRRWEMFGSAGLPSSGRFRGGVRNRTRPTWRWLRAGHTSRHVFLEAHQKVRQRQFRVVNVDDRIHCQQQPARAPRQRDRISKKASVPQVER